MLLCGDKGRGPMSPLGAPPGLQQALLLGQDAAVHMWALVFTLSHTFHTPLSPRHMRAVKCTTTRAGRRCIRA